MTARPNRLPRRPDRLAAPEPTGAAPTSLSPGDTRIDPLSDVLRTVKLTGALFFLVDASSPWGVEVPHADTLRPDHPAARPARRLVPHRPGRLGLGGHARRGRRRGSRPATSWCSRTATPTRCSARRAAAGVRRRGDAAVLARDGGRAGSPSWSRKAAAVRSGRAFVCGFSAATCGRSTRARDAAAAAARAARGRRAGTTCWIA